MQAPSKTLEFNILTTVGGMDQAEQQIAQFHSDMSSSLDSLKEYWLKYAQNVGLSANEVNRQLADITRGFELAKHTMETTTATKVRIDTGDMKLLVGEFDKVEPRAAAFIQQIEEIAQTYTSQGAVFSQQFKKDIVSLGGEFVTTNTDLTKFNNTIGTYLSALTASTGSMKGASTITDQYAKILTKQLPKIPTPPVEYAFKIDPEQVTNLKQLTGGLTENLEKVSRVGDANQRLTDLMLAVNQASGEAIKLGLDPLTSKFNELFTMLSEATEFREFSDDLNLVIQDTRASTTPFATLEQRLTALAASGKYAGAEMKPARDGIMQISEEAKKRSELIAFSDKLRALGEATDITGMRQMRGELSLLLEDARKTAGLEGVVKSLELMDKELAKGGGFVGKFKGELIKISDTTQEKAGVETIITELEKFGKELQAAGIDVDALIRDLRKFGVSPAAIKNLDTATQSLESLTQAAGVGARKSFAGLQENVDQSAKKMADVTAKGGGMLQSLNRIAFGAGGVGKMFGEMQVKMSQALISFGVIGIARNLMRDFSQAVQATARALYNLSYEAAKLRDAENAFRNIVGPARNAGEILSRVSTASMGAIERIELVGSATRAALAGLPVERFDELVIGARALAAATGRDASDALERLTNSIAKQERRLLDELGIVIRANEVYKEYALSINTSATSLTGAQRAAAFFEAVTKRVNEKVMMLGGTVDSAQIPFMRFQSSFRDLRVAFGGFLDRTLGVSEALSGLSRNFDDLAVSFSSTSEKSSKAMAALNSTEQAIRTLKKTVPEMIEEAEGLNEVLVSTTSTTVEQEKANKRLEEITSALIGLFPNLATILKDDLTKGLKQATAAAKEHLKVQQALYSIQLSKTIEANKEAFKDARKELAENKKTYDTLDAVVRRAGISGEKFVRFTKEEARALSIAASKQIAHGGAIWGSKIALEEVTAVQARYKKSLFEAQNAITVMNHDVARLVKSMIEQGEVAESDIKAFASMDKGAAKYKDTLLILSGKLGILEEDLDDAKDSVYNLLFAVKDAAPKQIKDVEDIEKELTELRKQWDQFGKVIAVVDVDSTPVERSAVELENLKAEQNDLMRVMLSSAGITGDANEALVKKMIADYEDYMYLRKNLALTDDEKMRKVYATWKDRLEKQQNLQLDALNISTGILDILFDASRDVYDKERELAKQRGQETIDNAQIEIAAGREVMESDIQNAQRALKIWQGVQSDLIAGDKWTAENRKRVLNEIAQVQKRITELERTEMIKATKERIDNELKVSSIISTTLTKMQGVSTDTAIALIGDLESVADEAPEQFKTVINGMMEILNLARKASDDRKIIGKEETDSFTDQVDKRLAEIEKATKAEADKEAELAEYVGKVQEARTKNRIDNLGRQRTGELKHAELYKDLQKEFYDITVATNKKQLDEHLIGIKRRIDTDSAYVADKNFLRQSDEIAERLHQERLATFQSEYTEDTLFKIKEASDLGALERIQHEYKVEEAGAIGKDRIWTALNNRKKELTNELLKHHQDAVAKQNDLESVAARERIRVKYDEIEKNIDADVKRLKSVGGNEEAIRALTDLRAENSKNRAREIQQNDDKMAKETELSLLKFEKKTTSNEMREATLRIELNFMEYEAKLESAKSFYDFLANEAKARGEDESKWIALSADAQDTLNRLLLLKTEALSDAEIEVDEKALQERLRYYKQLADYVGVASGVMLEFELAALSHERDERLRMLEIVNGTEEQKAAIIKAYSQKIKEAQSDLWQSTTGEAIKATIEINKSFTKVLASFRSETESAFSDFTEGFESGAKAMFLTIEAYIKPTSATILSALVAWFDTISLLFDEIVGKSRDATRKWEESMKKARQKMEELARSTGQAIGDAITSGMDVDFNELVRLFVKSKLAEQIADIFSSRFATNMDKMRLWLTRQAPDPEDIKEVQKQFERMGAVGVAEVINLLQVWGGEPAKATIARLKEMAKAGVVDYEELAKFYLMQTAELINIEGVFVNMKQKFGNIEPEFLKMVEEAEKVFGNITDNVSKLEEQIPTATFRAVTEPQANQMIVLLGRQTDYLAQIASNTARLNQQQPITPGEIPGQQGAAAAPALNGNQNININERLEITINGDTAMRVNRPEEINSIYLAGIIAEQQQIMIDQRESALGRSRIRTNRTR